MTRLLVQLPCFICFSFSFSFIGSLLDSNRNAGAGMAETTKAPRREGRVLDISKGEGGSLKEATKSAGKARYEKEEQKKER